MTRNVIGYEKYIKCIIEKYDKVNERDENLQIFICKS